MSTTMKRNAGNWEISMFLPEFVPVNVSDGVVVITGTITSSKQQQKACRQTATQQDKTNNTQLQARRRTEFWVLAQGAHRSVQEPFRERDHFAVGNRRFQILENSGRGQSAAQPTR
jgi:hypothetical protein